MKKGNPQAVSKQLQQELDALVHMPDAEIDTIEMPTVEDWSSAIRGAMYRPIKRPLSLRLDADIIDWFQRQGSTQVGYQTRINSALREYIQLHSKGPGKAATG
jgi:uncharacterized protein (DUF4415 family)